MNTLRDIQQANEQRHKELLSKSPSELPRYVFTDMLLEELGEMMAVLHDKDKFNPKGYSKQDLEEEMADVLISLCNLAINQNVDLGEAVVRKFNKSSKKFGSSTFLKKSEILRLKYSDLACDEGLKLLELVASETQGYAQKVKNKKFKVHNKNDYEFMGYSNKDLGSFSIHGHQFCNISYSIPNLQLTLATPRKINWKGKEQLVCFYPDGFHNNI